MLHHSQHSHICMFILFLYALIPYLHNFIAVTKKCLGQTGKQILQQFLCSIRSHSQCTVISPILRTQRHCVKTSCCYHTVQLCFRVEMIHPYNIRIFQYLETQFIFNNRILLANPHSVYRRCRFIEPFQLLPDFFRIFLFL